MWHELAVAFCLMLVIEGIIPFVAPQRWRHLLRTIEQIDDGTLRAIGLASMLVGTFALAMAFAANDLVNFIGVPMAGYHAYGIAAEAGDPMAVSMAAFDASGM